MNGRLERLRLKAGLKASRMVSPSFAVRAGQRDIAVQPHHWEVLHLLGWRSDWKTKLLAAMIRERDGLFVDVGANIGQTLLDYCASGAGSGYLGFEPNISLAAHLNGLIKHNGLANCTVVPTGLSDESGLITLYLDPNRPGDSGATMIDGLRPASATIPQVIAVSRFDQVRPNLPGGKIGAVKIDVEGAESLTLAGMTEALRTDRPWVLCEVLRRDPVADRDAYMDRLTRLQAILRDADYKVWEVVKGDDYATVVGLLPIEAFPEEVWARPLAERNDYVFLPVEDQDRRTCLLT